MVVEWIDEGTRRETGRVYNVLQWFLALLAVALVAPLVKSAIERVAKRERLSDQAADVGAGDQG